MQHRVTPFYLPWPSSRGISQSDSCLGLGGRRVSEAACSMEKAAYFERWEVNSN